MAVARTQLRMPLVSYSVVVVTWECADYLALLVDSMNDHLASDPQLVVVDNASSDDPLSVAQRWRGETTFIQLDDNVGFGRANNIGVRAAKHDALVLLNPDTKLVDGSLGALARESLKLGALVGPRVLDPDGSIQPSASGSPVGIWPWVNAFWPGAVMPAWVKARTEPWRLERRTPIAWLSGACIAAPRASLLRLGPFDSSIELYSEDLDLGLRAGRMGVRSFFDPEVCRVVHYADASARLRFTDRGQALAAENRRKVVRRLFGSRAERTAWWAGRVKFVVRIWAKTALRRSREHDVGALHALRKAGSRRRQNKEL
jgi:N-acetylglucosaminyl-diphospho-decaprenol L-rhamnosyltransferase